MQTIMIDGTRYASSRELHLALKRMLSLPDYYGMNADALNDCLSERISPVNLWIFDPGTGEVAAAVIVHETASAWNKRTFPGKPRRYIRLSSGNRKQSVLL